MLRGLHIHIRTTSDKSNTRHALDGVVMQTHPFTAKIKFSTICPIRIQKNKPWTSKCMIHSNQHGTRAVNTSKAFVTNFEQRDVINTNIEASNSYYLYCRKDLWKFICENLKFRSEWMLLRYRLAWKLRLVSARIEMAAPKYWDKSWSEHLHCICNAQ